MSNFVRIKEDTHSIDPLKGAKFYVVASQDDYYRAELFELAEGKSLDDYPSMKKKLLIDNQAIQLHKNNVVDAEE